jgi:hypothetical protein
MYYLGVCAYVCVHMEVSHIFFFRMKTFHYVVIQKDRENMDPSSGKLINIFSFTRIRRRNFYFFFTRISVVLSLNFSCFLFKHVWIVSCWVHPILSVEVARSFVFSLQVEMRLFEMISLPSRETKKRNVNNTGCFNEADRRTSRVKVPEYNCRETGDRLCCIVIKALERDYCLVLGAHITF